MMRTQSNETLAATQLEKLGVESIRIDLPFRLNHVNCFIAEKEEGWTIIDAGLNNASTRELWNEKIGDKQIVDILVTHYHPDHFGYIGGLQEKTGAKVWMSEIDAQAGMSAWDAVFLDTIPENYRASGIPEAQIMKMTQNVEEFQPLISPLPRVGQYLIEGDMVQIGKFDYRVIETPGHSDGMVCFYNEEQSSLFAADHILPKITPNISYWFHGHANPLAAYMESLHKIRKLNVEFVIPSHGNPFYGANQRIDELLKHHDERLHETLETIKTPLTVYETCQKLFQRPLTVHEMRFAVGETLSHLEYLRIKQDCIREKVNGIWRYEKR